MVKKAAKKGTRVKRATPVKDAPLPKGLELMKLETNVPLPVRSGYRDPVFAEKVKQLLKSMKVNQSFVIPKSKVHTTKTIVNREFEAYVIRVAVIKPEENFARVWRMK